MRKRIQDIYTQVGFSIANASYLRHKEKYQNQKKETRIKVLKYYSGENPKCACCGESTYEFLSIDHENNDGYIHRRQQKISNIVRWLIQNNFPKGFQVLCHNCNLAKGFYGTCPHLKNRTEND